MSFDRRARVKGDFDIDILPTKGIERLKDALRDASKTRMGENDENSGIGKQDGQR
jgi:translation initiation factor 2 alpha subunit (eIF-2alpha)